MNKSSKIIKSSHSEGGKVAAAIPADSGRTSAIGGLVKSVHGGEQADPSKATVTPKVNIKLFDKLKSHESFKVMENLLTCRAGNIFSYTKNFLSEILYTFKGTTLMLCSITSKLKVNVRKNKSNFMVNLGNPRLTWTSDGDMIIVIRYFPPRSNMILQNR